MSLLWLVVIAVAAYFAFTLVAGALKVAIVIAAVVGAIWVIMRVIHARTRT